MERSHLLNTPNSDRTLSTSQTVIAPPQLPKQRTACSSASLSHPSTPKQRTACSSASLSHPSTPQIAIALPPTSQKRTACKQRSHFLQLPKHSFFNEPQRRRERRGRISHFHPASFFNKPRRPEEHEGRREERAIAHLTPSIVR